MSRNLKTESEVAHAAPALSRARSVQIFARKAKKHAQRGFTLIEMMVAVALIGLLATLVSGSFSGDASKGAKLLADMTTIRDSVIRAKLDLGGVPKRLSVLWTRTDASAGNMFNGIVATTTWSGPYIERQSVDANNKITFPTIADAATVNIEREAASAANGGNLSFVYFLRAENIPRPIIAEFMKKCTGKDDTDANSVTFANGSCRTSVGSSEVGTVDIRITDSR